MQNSKNGEVQKCCSVTNLEIVDTFKQTRRRLDKIDILSKECDFGNLFEDFIGVHKGQDVFQAGFGRLI
jgi:hypothetical protein